MAKKRMLIVWESKGVGYVEDLTGDMFDLYGKWIPLGTAATQEFLTALQEGQQLWVTIGDTITGSVETIPGEEIEIKHSPASSDTKTGGDG